MAIDSFENDPLTVHIDAVAGANLKRAETKTLGITMQHSIASFKLKISEVQIRSFRRPVPRGVDLRG